MTDAPEKIWADPHTCTVDGSGAVRLLAMDREFSRGTEYTRSDLCLTQAGAEALVAAALERAAEKLDLRIQQIQPEMTRRAQRLTEGKKPGFQYALHRADLDARISCRDKIRAIANDPEAISRIIQSAKDVKAAEGRG